MTEYTPENPFGIGIEESTTERFYRKLRVSAASAMVGLTTAYVGSKAGAEVVADPIAIISEGMAVVEALGAGQGLARNLVMRLSSQDNS
jgi:hypothetical protein